MAYEIAQFDQFEWTMADERRPDVTAPATPEELSERGQRVLKANARLRAIWDESENGYPSDSERAYALAYHAGHAGLSVEDATWFLYSFYSRPGKKRLHRSKLQKTLRAWAKGRDKAKTEQDSHEGAREVEPLSVTVEHLTDLGNAKRLVARYGQDLRFCHPWRRWLVWDGIRWRPDETGEVIRWAKETALSIYPEARIAQDEELRKALARHAMRAEAESRVKAMIGLAESEPGIPVVPAALDTDPWLLTVQNGTLDLRMGTLREHRRTDLITKLAPVSYAPQATCPAWERFLKDIFPGRAELIAFLQRILGYSLTGDTREQCLFVCYGGGANGKTTLLRTVTDLLGDYAQWTPTDTLLLNRRENASNDLARLRGARFVAAAEAESGRRISEALVKAITGGDRIVARFLFAEFFEFVPTFKVWLAVNHRPVVRETTVAVWRRIKLIPFTVTIPEERWDRELPERLRIEFSGILAWVVRGCLDWQRHGLGTPEEVRYATATYQAEMDVLAGFLADRCERDREASATAKELYTAYRAWCEENGEKPESQRWFGEKLGERGFTHRRSTGGAYAWFGLRLRSE